MYLSCFYHRIKFFFSPTDIDYAADVSEEEALESLNENVDDATCTNVATVENINSSIDNIVREALLRPYMIPAFLGSRTLLLPERRRSNITPEGGGVVKKKRKRRQPKTATATSTPITTSYDTLEAAADDSSTAAGDTPQPLRRSSRAKKPRRLISPVADESPGDEDDSSAFDDDDDYMDGDYKVVGEFIDVSNSPQVAHKRRRIAGKNIKNCLLDTVKKESSTLKATLSATVAATPAATVTATVTATAAATVTAADTTSGDISDEEYLGDDCADMTHIDDDDDAVG